MKIIAIRQNENGLNEFFITEGYEEFSITQLIEEIENGKFPLLSVGVKKNGTKFVRSTAASKEKLEDCALTCRDSDYLLFDLTWLYLKAGNGHVKRRWRAYSGITGSSSNDQSKEDVGPLPEGDYTVKFDGTLDIQSSTSLYDRLKWLIKSPDWGLIVTPLEPSSKNKMYGRKGFTIHGGYFPGSKGCIDLTGNNKDFHVTTRLYKRNLELIVRYPK